MSSNAKDAYNKGGFNAFIFSLVFSFGFIFYISFIHPGVDLKEIPKESDASTALAGGAAGDLPKDFDIAKVAKPWETSPELVAFGKKSFTTNCSVCHGAGGLGDGAAGAALVPKPRNLVEGGWKQGGGAMNLYKTLITGIPGGSMASFKHLPKGERWALAHFIVSITKDKGPDADLAQLEEYARNAE